MPKAIEERIDELNAALEALETRPLHFDPAEQAIAGVFLSLDNAWGLRIDRGFVRREDEPAPDPVAETADSDVDPVRGTAPSTGPTDGPVPDEEDDEGGRPLPERLITDLTAHRTLALTDALAQDPEVAYLAALHVLALRQFYRTGSDSCLEISPRTVLLGVQTTPDLAEAPYAIAVQARHEAWEKRLPQDPAVLWGVLTGFDRERRDALFAHCVSLTVNGIHDPYQRKPRAMAHADVLASTVGLNMVRAGWEPTVASYFGRLTKAQILETVHEARGSIAADRIAALKKPAMAAAAEELLTDKGWLPPILRTAPLPQEIEGDFVLVTIEGDPAGGGVEGAVVSELPQGEPEDSAHTRRRRTQMRAPRRTPSTRTGLPIAPRPNRALASSPQALGSAVRRAPFSFLSTGIPPCQTPRGIWPAALRPRPRRSVDIISRTGVVRGPIGPWAIWPTRPAAAFTSA